MMHIPVLLSLASMPMLSPEPSTQTTLASLRHDYRPLLVFSRSSNNEFEQQMRMLGERRHELEDRQILVIPILLEPEQEYTAKALPENDITELEPSERVLARRRFHVAEDDFAVVLVGKDGGEKLRAKSFVTIERLIKLIDSMPIRQKELRDGHSG